MDYANLAREQHKKSAEILESALTEEVCLQALNKSYTFITDISTCIAVIERRRERALFELSLKEFQFGLFTLTQGLYRHAFSALRLSFELALSAVEFSANELSLRRWENGANDINWHRIINADTGIFSVNFVRAFMDGIDDRCPHFRTMAEKVYRECSEYVHGNASTHIALPSDLAFSKEIMLSWCEKASTINMVVLFAFFIRYLQDLDETKRKAIESPFIEALGHIPLVRLTFGAAA